MLFFNCEFIASGSFSIAMLELVLKFANVQDLNKHLKDVAIEYVYLFDEEKNKFIFKHVDDARFKTLKKIQRVSNIL